MSKVFVCSPFAGDIRRNKRVARQVCREFALAGDIPIAPHLLFPQFLDDTDKTERDMGFVAGIDLLMLCDRMYVYVENGISAGMKTEIEMAEKLEMQIEYSDGSHLPGNWRQS